MYGYCLTTVCSVYLDRVQFAVAYVNCPSTNTSVTVSLMHSKLMVLNIYRMYSYRLLQYAYIPNVPINLFICMYAS